MKVLLSRLRKNKLASNSSWGVLAYLGQAFLQSLFFIIIARHYSVKEFADYLIAIGLYQLVSVLATLGLSQWFIREYAISQEKEGLIYSFFKIQLINGLLFYSLNIAIAYILYDEKIIIQLSYFLGANIIIDNIINSIKCLNIVEFNQNKTFKFLLLEATLKVIICSSLFYYPTSISLLSIGLLITRFITLNFILRYGSAIRLDIKRIFYYTLPFKTTYKLIIRNWPFIIIGGVAVLNWRISNIIISKVLTAFDVATYEISYKFFSIAQMLPVIISATAFPILIKLNNNNQTNFKIVYRRLHLYYQLFGLLSFTIIVSFSDSLIYILFGSAYKNVSIYTEQLFFTMLVFPTVFLNANTLIALKMERTDMWLNIINLFINISLITIGLTLSKSLTIINISIFTSFLIFQILQDKILISKKIGCINQMITFYLINIIGASYYFWASFKVNPTLLFIALWFSIIIALFIIYQYNRDKHIIGFAALNVNLSPLLK